MEKSKSILFVLEDVIMEVFVDTKGLYGFDIYEGEDLEAPIYGCSGFHDIREPLAEGCNESDVASICAVALDSRRIDAL